MTTDAVGGVWRYSLDAARALEAHGVQTTLAVVGPDPSPDQQVEAAGLHVMATGLPLDWAGAELPEITQAARELAALAADYDVVQLNQPAFASLADWPVPVLAAAHSCVATWWSMVEGDAPFPAELAWQPELMRAGLNAAAASIAPTAAFAAMLAARHHLARVPIAVHNGRAAAPLVPVAPIRARAAAGNKRDLRAPANDATASASAQPSADAVMACGRLWDTGKNMALLDRIAPRLPLPVRMFGAVEGPNGARFIGASVQLYGQTSTVDLARHFAARPIFAAPSLYEPFGLAVLEAAQAGCALVLADIPTFRELWDGAAVFADPRAPEAWIAALNGPLDRAALGEAARTRAAVYTVERMATRLHGILAGVALTEIAA